MDYIIIDVYDDDDCVIDTEICDVTTIDTPEQLAEILSVTTREAQDRIEEAAQ